MTAEALMGRFEAMYDGPYAVMQGNVALFDGLRLIARVYGAKASDRAIGSVEAIESGGVRIWDGRSPGSPVGDIRAEGIDLMLGPLAAEQSFCHGKAVVPTIYSMPIGKARTLLQAKGWKPVPAKLEAKQDREIVLAKRGVVEVDGGAPTGFAFCSFNYTGVGGVLTVTTVEDTDFPSVTRYSVERRRP